MKRIHHENINTPGWFDSVWRAEGIHGYDQVRMEAFLDGILFDDILLDVGAGWMGIAQYAIQHDRVHGAAAVDFSEEARRRTLHSLGIKAQYIEYRIANALELPCSGFDRVCCGELIEHMEKPEKLVAELARVCKVGGKIIIGTLDDTCEDAKRHGDYPEHLWSFTPSDLVCFLAPHVVEAKYRLVGDYHFVEGIRC